MLSSIHFGIMLLLTFVGSNHESSVVKRRKNHKIAHTIAAKHGPRIAAAKRGVHRGMARSADGRRGQGEEQAGRIRRRGEDAFMGKIRRDDPSWALSNHFAIQRGRLPWPVDSRRVSVHFGYYSYLRNVKGNSRCISIEVEDETEVRAVCDGEVESVMDLGDARAVLLRHGRYFTVYSNLPEVDVARGDSVKGGQVLGRMTDAGQLDFYVYYEDENWFFDPERWLKR